jgi:hypothetical protein
MQPIAILTAWAEPTRDIVCRVEIGLETCAVVLQMPHASMSQTVVSRLDALHIATSWRERFADSSPLAA